MGPQRARQLGMRVVSAAVAWSSSTENRSCVPPTCPCSPFRRTLEAARPHLGDAAVFRRSCPERGCPAGSGSQVAVPPAASSRISACVGPHGHDGANLRYVIRAPTSLRWDTPLPGAGEWTAREGATLCIPQLSDLSHSVIDVHGVGAPEGHFLDEVLCNVWKLGLLRPCFARSCVTRNKIPRGERAMASTPSGNQGCHGKPPQRVLPVNLRF